MLLTGVRRALRLAGDPGAVSVWGRELGREARVGDAVVSWSTSLAGGAAAHLIIWGAAGAHGAGVDVLGVSSVFAFLGVTGAITVYNRWKTEEPLSEPDSWYILTIGKTAAYLIREWLQSYFSFFLLSKRAANYISSGEDRMTDALRQWILPAHSHTLEVGRRGTGSIYLDVPRFESQLCVALDKVGNPLSFSFIICKMGMRLPSVVSAVWYTVWKVLSLVFKIELVLNKK